MDVTEDQILNGRVTITQPAQGYRAAIDPVFLAASISARAGDTVLDAGCGVGAAMLCLAARLPECRVTGVEIQKALAVLARENILLNRWQDRLSAVEGDVGSVIPDLKDAQFDHVMSNPPFYDPGQVSLPLHSGKRAAHAESTADLETWLSFCLHALKPKGHLTVIYPAASLGRMLAALRMLKCSSKVFPLWPRVSKPAKRVLIQARRDRLCTVDLLPGLILHQDDGRYTEEAEAILRGAQALCFE
jgi:tRNA1(Val) A37 N6-methylase TrmN6